MSTSRHALNAEALRLMNAGRLEEARVAAERSVAGLRACMPAHGLLAVIHQRLGDRQAAVEVVEAAAAYDDGIADGFDALAYASLQLGLHEQSNRLYHRATEAAPRDARYWYNLATSERAFGRLREAEVACQKAIDANASAYQAYLLRAELQVQSERSNHVDELLAVVRGRGIDDRGRMFLGYALGKELDDLSRFDEAFSWFALGAGTRRRHLQYDVAADEHKLARVAEVFSPGLLQAPGADAGRSGDHVFVLGLPRSGTTLVERILTGHAGVRSNGETDNFSTALLGSTVPVATGAPAAGAMDVFARAAAADPNAVGERYASLAGSCAEGGRVVEKLPMNYLYIGAIHRALPAARLVLVRRDPLDSCFAMYRTLFAAAYPFSYNMAELARYYAAYDRLVGHWRRSLGEALHEVIYEELVAQPAETSARLLRHVGIDWDPGALAVEKQSGVSFTASAAQVRRPIYGSSSGRWRHYRTHLAPLITAMRSSGVSLPSDA